MEKVPNYIRDSMDFLNKIPETTDHNKLLVTFDVTSLYTNIPHDFGLQAIRFWIEKYPELIPRNFTLEFILNSIQFILENNTFHFDGEFYQQIKGTAMGTKMAPTYSILVMGYFEEILYQKIEEEMDKETGEYIRNTWKRYLDDVFILWTKPREELEKFHKLLNTLNPNIQFTIEYSDCSIPFLDIMVTKRQTNIITDIFYKATDTHQYLNFKSCHPTHTKRNIPYNLARRICSIVTDENIRNQRLEELNVFLSAQNYPEKLILSAIEEAKKIPQEILRTTRKNVKDPYLIPFVTTYNPKHVNIFQEAMKNFNIIERDQELQQLIHRSDLLQSQRQPPNLKKLLTKAKFNSKPEKYAVTKCGDSRCGTCPYLKTGSSFSFKCGKTFYVNENMSCKSKNLLYCIICNNCGDEYIGQTGTQLTARMRVHRQQINDPSIRNTPCSEHFDNCAMGNYQVFPFYKLKTDSTSMRLVKENYFIKLFSPKLNKR